VRKLHNYGYGKTVTDALKFFLYSGGTYCTKTAGGDLTLAGPCIIIQFK